MHPPVDQNTAKPFNLLISTGRGLEQRCISTIRQVFSNFDSDLAARRSGFSGLVKAWVREPREAVRHMVKVLEEEPWHNEIIKRMVPIDTVVSLDPKDILLAAIEVRDRFAPRSEESFRVRVRKRGAPIDRMEMIITLADLFQNRVDLEHPDFEVRVEMLRREAGVSLLRRGDIFPDL